MNLKKIALGIGVIGLLGIMGCSSPNNTKVEEDYLRCNDTSNGNMAETEDGYFIGYANFLYYADKTDLNTWVPVCNKPNCMHNSRFCNGYLLSFNKIIQKEDKLYGLAARGNASLIGSDTNTHFIYEIATDGSGTKKVYDIPMGDGNVVTGMSSAEFHEQIVVNGSYLDEKGITNYEIVKLQEDEKGNVVLEELYKGTENVFLMSGNLYWSIRGDDVVANSLGMEEGTNLFRCLWRVEEEGWEKLKIPEDVNLQGGYLSGNTFRYFQQNEGFYEIDLTSGERTLLCENWFEDSVAYILSEDYMIEYTNKDGYDKANNTLKFYNGTGWYNVAWPEEVKRPNDYFGVLSVASDRIFMVQRKEEGHDFRSYIYYFMLDDDTPELTYCGEVTSCGEEVVEESTEQETIESDKTNFETITVFDNEDFLFQITGFYKNEKNRFCIKTYWENKSNKANYDVLCKYVTVNGLMCYVNQGVSINANEICEDSTDNNTDNEFHIIADKVNMPESMIQYNFTDKHWFEIKEVYHPEEYTDIALYLHVSEDFNTIIEDEVVHIYPYGEENVIHYTREVEETDNVLVDNDYVTILVRGYEDGIIPNGNVKFYFVNKTDKRIKVSIDELYVNGFPLKHNLFTRQLYEVVINEDCSALHTLASNYFSNSITEHEITKVEELKMLLRVYPVDYVEKQIGEDLVNEVFTLTP